MTETTTGRRWGWRLAVVPVAVVAVVGGITLTGASQSSATYRTATASKGDVTQTLTTTGAIESASRSDLGFQVDGTVDTVDVVVGDSVEAGDTLASLDLTDLEDAVSEAKEALSEAEETLADDLDAQSDDSSDSASEVSSSTGGEESTATVMTVAYAVATAAGTVVQAADDATSTDAVEEARQALLDAQQALLDQYDIAQAALEAADQASADAQTICADFTSASGDDTTDGGDGTDTGDGTETETTDSTLTDALTACQDATDAALTASQESIAAQAELMDLATAVDDAVAAYQQALEDAAASGDSDGTDEGDDTGTDAGDGDAAGGDTTAPGGDAGAQGDGTEAGSDGMQPEAGGDSLEGDASGMEGMTPSEGDGGGDASMDSSMSGSGGAAIEESVPTAADILADKAEITAAEADLAVAQQRLEYAELTAPVAGEIVAVGFSAGDDVTAGDTAAVITLVADNSYVVNLSVTLTEAQLLEVGQDAELTLTSTGDVVEGSVSSVSNVNSGNAYQQSYAVAVAVPDPGIDIRIGAATRMTITVAASTDVLVVPTSAISDAAGDATVQVVGDDGAVTETPIVTGAIGTEYTEVVSGLDSGADVALADLTQELTTDEEESESSGLLGGLDSESEDSDEFQMPEGFTPPSGGGGDFQPPTMNG
ncbi:biotin/lipoyl-binding protein [Demequina sp. NBRC 110057]|uniref:HlyD family efflux transporter periplasmic adaptor subunit n=1 Tax=Demequina sp. NBRC 110057 TaxID=1570346 RepID=UPI0009FBA14B|nr:biotin/lipoyl-binding protein [Demequina sp. NBRC 110057]